MSALTTVIRGLVRWLDGVIGLSLAVLAMEREHRKEEKRKAGS